MELTLEQIKGVMGNFHERYTTAANASQANMNTNRGAAAGMEELLAALEEILKTSESKADPSGKKPKTSGRKPSPARGPRPRKGG